MGSTRHLQGIPLGTDGIAPSWKTGQRVRVRGDPGLQPKSAVVLRVLMEEVRAKEGREPEDPCPRYDLLFDDETRAVVSGAVLLGSPSVPATLLRRAQTSTGKPGGAQASRGSKQGQHGVLARTEEPDMQRLQVLAVVQSAMTNLQR